MIAYAQALLVDRKKLTEAQKNNDVVTAQEILQHAFRTDVRAIGGRSKITGWWRFKSAGNLPERKSKRKFNKRKRTENGGYRIVRNGM